ncbi:anti-anti-sigma factor [Nocardioides zeae]|uniref:Anti-anti-sigma factor n=2 Tax=Nocardioides zeae TaxID=1457234 RepID=A0ACC6ILN9_9ACTN|nr:STAS domain-containing protein [Nocardioides zeae]MDQ1105247.1 anti-anti-sigma factor [Nocardioides zeae]MDR6175038.1 anti-anti-sigma factor [Nocardioides zeae]MDR6211616.1 anti-anti-sigma factor [Nocardioides zeae]
MEEPPFASALDPTTRTVTVTGGVWAFRDVEELDRAITAASEGLTRSITLDLSRADFLPSLGIGTLLSLRRRMRLHGADLTVVAAPGTVAHRVLTITGVEVVESDG